MAISFTDEKDVEHKLPTKWRICSACDGHGKSSAYLGAFTRDKLAEQGPDWCEDYFAGNYDRRCEPCGGSGKVEVVDRGRAPKALLKEWDAAQEADRLYEAECRAEQLFCGGWREEGWR